MYSGKLSYIFKETLWKRCLLVGNEENSAGVCFCKERKVYVVLKISFKDKDNIYILYI